MANNKIQFGMVVDKLEKRDYTVDDLTANVFFWNYFNPNVSCYGYSQQSSAQPESHAIEIARTRLGIQPEESQRVCFYGTYVNSNVWRHQGSQYRVHSQLIFDLEQPLGEWEVQLVFDEGKKMLVMETPQMVKKDRSKDNQFWSFSAADFNRIIVTKKTKFFITGAMWRSTPAPASGTFSAIPMQSRENNSENDV